MKREFVYHVIFYYNNNHTTGIGTMEYIRSKPIKNYDDINEVTDFIKGIQKANQIIILNWRRIKNRKRTGVPENEN